MKLALTTICLAAMTNLFAGSARAGSMDLEIHVQPKQTDQSGIKAQSGGSRYHSKEHWLYEVSIENKSFKQLDGVELKYVIFSKHEKFGSKDPAEEKRSNGGVSVGSLKPHEKRSVATTAVELDKTQLDGDYYFPDGGKEKAQDSLVGVWVRAYQNGQQIAEYANPSTLLKGHWE
ncbi:MAG TPA: hypothetical protein VGG94_05110 [Chthoniobacterales bacterium]|jgi:hypothetical protein